MIITKTKSEQWRANWFWGKEPETIRWIERMIPNDRLWDVGANIGVYTLYAASRGVNVVAFEPDLKNYLRLKENLALNGLDVLVCNVALGDGGVVTLEESFETGASGGGARFRTRGIRGDSLRFAAPTHIKIDTDGGELGILEGMSGILGGVREVLVEVNVGWLEIVDHMRRKGFMIYEQGVRNNFIFGRRRDS